MARSHQQRAVPIADAAEQTGNCAFSRHSLNRRKRLKSSFLSVKPKMLNVLASVAHRHGIRKQIVEPLLEALDAALQLLFERRQRRLRFVTILDQNFGIA